MPGVRARHARPRLGAPHLERHHRLALGVGRLQGAPQLGGVLEALEVAGDDGGVVVVGEVLDEVGRFEVELVARRHPAAEGHAELGPLHEGTALVPALGHEPDAAAAPGGRLGEDLEGVGVGVGAEDAHAVAARHLAHLALEGGTGLAHLAEAGREDEHVGHAVLAALLHHAGHEPGPHVDHGQGDRGGDVGDVLVDRDVADRTALGVDEVPAVPPALAVGGAQTLGLGVAVHRTDDGHRLGVEELLEVASLLGWRALRGRAFVAALFVDALFAARRDASVRAGRAAALGVTCSAVAQPAGVSPDSTEKSRRDVSMPAEKPPSA